METIPFKLWLLDAELTALLEALDVINAMEFSVDRELNKITGAPFQWTKYIVSIVVKFAGGMAKGGYFEDIVTDTINGILFNAQEGGLKASIEEAKARSNSPAELLENMKGVIMQAAKMRAMDFRRKYGRQQTRMLQFGQVDGDEGDFGISRAMDHGPRPEDHADSESLEHQVIAQLDAMIQQARATKQTRLVKRLELAKALAPDRMSGMQLPELMAKHGLKQTQVHSILQDIYAAIRQINGGELAGQVDRMLGKTGS
jgi:DnaJ-domain-containing protein 1